MNGFQLLYDKLLLEVNLKTESNPAKTECGEATNLKGCRVWVILSESRVIIRIVAWVVDDLDQ